MLQFPCLQLVLPVLLSLLACRVVGIPWNWARHASQTHCFRPGPFPHAGHVFPGVVHVCCVHLPVVVCVETVIAFSSIVFVAGLQWWHVSSFCSGVFSSPDLVSKFIKEFDAAKLATDSCCDSPWVLGHDGYRRGPGAVYKYWAWCGVSGFGWPPRRTGEERVAGSLLAPGLSQAVRVLLRLWLCEWVLLRLWLFAWVLLRLGAWARVLLRWWLCARVQPRLRAFAWVLVWAVAQLPRAPWLLRVVGRCSRPGVASFCEGLFFCVATQSCVSLQSEAYLSLSFVHSRSCQGVLTLCWSVGL